MSATCFAKALESAFQATTIGCKTAEASSCFVRKAEYVRVRGQELVVVEFVSLINASQILREYLFEERARIVRLILCNRHGQISCLSFL